MSKPKFMRRTALLLVLLLSIAAALGYAGMEQRWYRAPYDPIGRTVAWWFGMPERAYNFDQVLPGRLFRSSRPDARFVEYLHETYGIDLIVSLAGESEAHRRARALGVEVVSFVWRTGQLPPLDQLQTVMGLIDSEKTVLVHCAGGSDRTGYTMAIHRVLKQGWALGSAVEEMTRYWHDPGDKPRLHTELEQYIANTSGARSIK